MNKKLSPLLLTGCDAPNNENTPARGDARQNSVQGVSVAKISYCRSDAPVPCAGTSGPMDFTVRYRELCAEVSGILKGIFAAGREDATCEERARLEQISDELAGMPDQPQGFYVSLS